MVKNLDKFLAGWKQRLNDREEDRSNRFENARSSANICANILLDEFGVEDVYLVGSAVDPESFHSRSDIDIAVRGLAPEDYFSALSRCFDELPPEFSLDLIDFKDLSPNERNKLIESGERLTA